MMKNKILRIIAVFLVIICLAGCSDDGLDKVLKYDISGNPQTLDPQQSGEPNSDLIISNVFCGLFKKGEDGSLRNGVCEDFSVSEDGLEYNFKLREDIFWLGDDFEEPCTAEDFVFGFERLFLPETNAPHAEDYFCIKNSKRINEGSEKDISKLGVKAKGDFELEITLDYPNPRFLDMLCDPPAMPCCEKFFNNSHGKYGLCAECTPSNGAFCVVSWTYSPYAITDINNLILTRNSKNAEAYGVCPSTLNFFIEDEEDFVSDFLSEEVTCLAVSNENKPLIKGDYPCDEYPCITCGLIFNKDYELFQNRDFRKALALLVDRDEIISGISGYEKADGVVAKQVTINGTSYRELAGGAGNLVFDSEKSAELLKKAKPSLDTALFTGARIIVPDEISETAVSYIMQEWQHELGFYCKLQRLSASEYAARLESGDYDIAMLKLSGKYDSPAAYLEKFSGDDSFYYNAYFEILLNRAEKAIDSSESVKIYLEAEKTLIDDAGFLPIYYEDTYFFRQKDTEDIFYDPFTKTIDFTQGKRK